MSEVGSALARGLRGMPWLVRGDVDGFFGLFRDNLVQLLLIEILCRGVLRFPPELLYRTVLPGAAVSLLLGNLFYSWQAKRLARRDRQIGDKWSSAGEPPDRESP